ncbi:MAG: Ppx/GppA phosphatase family protein [Acidobacteria bacterium]|nr:Ppx/GppA phosphatase family protein [Acidobacteriota bacterium]
MRIAAIDIGTNSVHVIIVQVRADRSFEIIDREKEMVRLGSGGLGGRSLTEPAMLAALQALGKFTRLAESHDVDEIVAAATSAVREADNGREFLGAIRQRTGIQVRVISGTEEARLIHRAAVYGVDVSGGAAVVIDVGGGSVELTQGTGARAHVAQSLKLGVIRLTEQFIRSDPLSRRDERQMVSHITETIAPTVEKIVSRGFDRVIGTSGTILSLGSLAVGEGRAVGSDDLRSRRVSAKQIRRLRRDLCALDLPGRLRLPGLDPRRADLAVAGSILLDTVLRQIGAVELTLCDLALREGLALDYLSRNRAHIAKVEQFPDVRRRSVVELAERCNYASEHAEQVRRLSLSLFDQTQPAHGLGAREREWLDHAALLHDIGVHISYGRHHKHSYYLIKNGDLRGFEPEEVEAIALVARHHRRGLPKKSRGGYASLPARHRRTVRTLAAMLRLAEGLDRSHAQSVGSVEIVPGLRDYLLRLTPAGDTELELWAAQRSVAPLEAILGRIIRFEVDSDATRASLRSSRQRRRPAAGSGESGSRPARRAPR